MLIVRKDLARLRAVEEAFDSDYASVRSRVPAVEQGGCTAFHWRLANAFERVLSEQRIHLADNFRALSGLAILGWVLVAEGVIGATYLGIRAYSWRIDDPSLCAIYTVVSIIALIIAALATFVGVPSVRRVQDSDVKHLERLLGYHFALATAMVEGDRGGVEWALSVLAGEPAHSAMLAAKSSESLHVAGALDGVQQT